MSTCALVAVYVQYNDVGLDGDSCRAFGALGLREQARRASAEELGIAERCLLVYCAFRKNDSAVVARVDNVLYADLYASTNDLLHSKGMNDFGAVESQFSGLGRRDGGEQASCRDLARVCREDAVDFFPDL